MARYLFLLPLNYYVPARKREGESERRRGRERGEKEGERERYHVENMNHSDYGGEVGDGRREPPSG